MISAERQFGVRCPQCIRPADVLAWSPLPHLWPILVTKAAALAPL
jgi:hypothetical protein